MLFSTKLEPHTDPSGHQVQDVLGESPVLSTMKAADCFYVKQNNVTNEANYWSYCLKTFQFLPVFICILLLTVEVLNLLQNVVQYVPMYNTA